jgi:hypothetical protein
MMALSGTHLSKHDHDNAYPSLEKEQPANGELAHLRTKNGCYR